MTLVTHTAKKNHAKKIAFKKKFFASAFENRNRRAVPLQYKTWEQLQHAPRKPETDAFLPAAGSDIAREMSYIAQETSDFSGHSEKFGDSGKSGKPGHSGKPLTLTINQQKPQKTMIKFTVIPRKNILSEEILYYAQIKQDGVTGINELAHAIEKTSTVTRADILAVLSDLEEVIYSELRAGRGVKLGDLGSFRPTLKSEGVENAKDFDQNNIRKVNVVFIPSTNMKYQLSKKNPFVQFRNVTPVPEPEPGE